MLVELIAPVSVVIAHSARQKLLCISVYGKLMTSPIAITSKDLLAITVLAVIWLGSMGPRTSIAKPWYRKPHRLSLVRMDVERTVMSRVQLHGN